MPSKILGAASVVLIALTASCRSAARPTGPFNFLLITLDTLRADRLGCYGYAQGATPRLDGFASEGARFAQAISPVPLTLPAHATMLTGQFPMGHGVRDNGTFRLSAEEITMAEILKERGYDTAAFISSFVVDSRFGLAQGFDTYYDFDEEPGASRRAMRGLSEVQRIGEETVAPALDWLSQARDRPFFLWIHLYDPHSPFEAPEPYGSRFASRPYDGEVAYTDFTVGQVLDKLDSLGLTESTVVIVAGDHGESLGQHGEEYHSWFIYDATLQVPFLARLPGLILPGLVIEEQVRLSDLAPTALDLLGIPRESWQQMQGVSLASVLTGDTKSVGESKLGQGLPAYAESLVAHLQFGWGELKAIRHQDYKYIDAPRPELYDLSRDPGETKDLSEEKPTLVRQLRSRLKELEEQFRRGTEDSRAPQIDAETARALQALGYTTAPRASTNEELSRIDPKDRIADYRELSTKLSMAMEAIDSDKPTEAVRLLEPLARKMPAHSMVHYQLGLAQLQQNDYRRAAGELKIALDLAPSFSQARADLAEAYILSRQPELAIPLLQEGLKEQPDNPVFLFNLGFAYHAQKDFGSAQEAYRRAHELEQSHPQPLSNLAALYLQTNRADAAASRLEKLVVVDPENAMAWNNLGLARAMAGRMEDAGRAFEKAAQLDPENVAFRKNLVIWYQRMGRHQEAEAELRKLRSLEPSSPRGVR